MSNGEGYRKFKVFALVGVFLVAGIMLFMSFNRETEREEETRKLLPIPFESLDVSYNEERGASISAVAKKDDIEAVFEEKGIIASAIFKFLPEKVELFAQAEVGLSNEEAVSLKFTEMSVNGLKLPDKLLSEIGEISLDFKRSLVYN